MFERSKGLLSSDMCDILYMHAVPLLNHSTLIILINALVYPSSGACDLFIMIFINLKLHLCYWDIKYFQNSYHQAAWISLCTNITETTIYSLIFNLIINIYTNIGSILSVSSYSFRYSIQSIRVTSYHLYETLIDFDMWNLN